MNNYEPITECVACGHHELHHVLDLGMQPLANVYRQSLSDEELTFPLGINSCPLCHHVQLTHTVNPELMFKDYVYMSSVSKTGVDFFKWFAKMSVDEFDTPPKNVLDIGCNDCIQLDFYKQLGLETYGVDPAENLHKTTSKRHNVICDFFRDGLMEEKFDIITVQNAFAHNHNQFELLKSIKPRLNDNGLLFIVTSQADMLLNGEFDTIYHEHISFYNTNSMNELCKRVGLNLIDVKKHPIHGNSYIFIISSTKKDEENVRKRILEECKKGLYNQSTLDDFRNKALETVKKVQDFVKDCEEKGILVVGYGAPAKGNTFMNYAKIKPKFIIDDTPLKQNKYTPGMGVSVYGISAFDEIDHHKQVCFIIFAWNFYEEIKEKIVRHRNLFPKFAPKNDILVGYFPNFITEKV